MRRAIVRGDRCARAANGPIADLKLAPHRQNQQRGNEDGHAVGLESGQRQIRVRGAKKARFCCAIDLNQCVRDFD
jgi:hypothetical protein